MSVYCNSTHHIYNFEVSIGEDNSIRWSGHWQHEGKGGGHCGGDHEVQGVHMFTNSLEMKSNDQKQSGYKFGHNFINVVEFVWPEYNVAKHRKCRSWIGSIYNYVNTANMAYELMLPWLLYY